MLFAIVTGLVYGRFSRPSARVGFSDRMLVAPYGDGLSLQFRIVNRRSNNLLELNARVTLMTVESVEGRLRRKFVLLDLERDQIVFFPLTWTIVHPIRPESPLYNKTAADIAEMQAEFLVFVKAFDETFGQTVYSRRSYLYNEIVWGARFTPAFEIDKTGDLRLEMDTVSSFETVALPPGQ
jgi:inward rectifier potassium channel